MSAKAKERDMDRFMDLLSQAVAVLKKRKQYLSKESAAAILDMTPDALYAKVLRREIPVIHKGRMIRFDYDDLVHWMNTHKVPSGETK